MEDNRLRPHQVKLRLNDEELDLLDKKVELAGARSRMDFLRHLIVYGAVFKVDLSEFVEYNTLLAHIDKLNTLTEFMEVENNKQVEKTSNKSKLQSPII